MSAVKTPDGWKHNDYPERSSHGILLAERDALAARVRTLEAALTEIAEREDIIDVNEAQSIARAALAPTETS